MDHVLPKPQFQIHTIGNIQTLCRKCNLKKNTRAPSEEEYMIIEEYLIEANKRFSALETAGMNNILKDHFTSIPKKKKTPPIKTYLSPAEEAKKRLKEESSLIQNRILVDTAHPFGY
jgi:hypothetical protein